MNRRHAWQVMMVIALMAGAGLACTLGNPSEEQIQDAADRPLVIMLAPVNGSVIADGVEVMLYAVAQDSGPGVTRLEFRVDDLVVGEVSAEQLDGQSSLVGQVPWRAAGHSGHLLTVEAFRADGSSLGVSDVTVRVIEKPVAQLPGTEQEVGTNPIPTLTPAPTLALLPGVAARVTSSDLNVRQGPGINYPVVGSLRQGDMVEIVGRSADNAWWAITFRSGTAWVYATLVQPEGDVSQVPLATVP